MDYEPPSAKLLHVHVYSLVYAASRIPIDAIDMYIAKQVEKRAVLKAFRHEKASTRLYFINRQCLHVDVFAHASR